MLLKNVFSPESLRQNWQAYLMVLFSVISLLIAFFLVVNSSFFTQAVIDKKSTGDWQLPVRDNQLSKLTQLHFFFLPQPFQSLEDVQPQSSAAAEGDPLFNAPVSKLDFQVTGIINAIQPQHSLVIVQQNQKQHSLVIGDMLPDTHAEIVRIFTDRVILHYNGKYESLRMNNQ